MLRHVKESLASNGIRDISVASGYGRLLTLLAQISGARVALEIGALGGYSGICLARGLPVDGKLYSLEINEEYARLAYDNMCFAGFGDRVEYRVGAALDSLEALRQEGVRLDFCFIDADKANYPVYLEMAISMSNPGALIAADNLFLRGRTLNEASQGQSATRMRAFNAAITSDPRLEGVILPAYDGLAIARVKPS